MVQLLTTYLRPYRKQVALVIALLFVQAIANLYLPNLNADIINNGVAKGDTPYIWRTGGIMLVVTFLMGVASIVVGLLGLEGRDGASAATCAARSSARSRASLRPRSTSSARRRSSRATPTTCSRCRWSS